VDKIKKAVLFILLAPALFLQHLPRSAADTNEVFLQTDWSGGASALNAAHPANKTGWAKFSSKDDYVQSAVSSQLMESAETLSFTDTAAADFSSGTLDLMSLTGSGEGASLELDAVESDPFVDDLGQWTSLPETPSMQFWSAFVKAGGYVYSLWERKVFARFSVADEKWEFMADMPGPIGHGAALAYPGSGDFIYAARGAVTKEFYKYSISGNAWTRLADIPYFMNTGGSLVSDGNDKIYCTVGGSTQRFYVYTVSTNTWTAKANIYSTWTAETGASLAYYPATPDYVYFMPYYAWTYFTRYRISTNVWEVLPACPVASAYLAYPGTGEYMYAWYPGDTVTGRVARYNLTTAAWENLTQVSSFPMNFSQGLLFYPGTGTELKLLSNVNYSKLFTYDPVTKKWAEPMPVKGINPPDSATTMVWDGNDYMYQSRGAGGAEFARYSISNNSWTARASMPWGVYLGTSMTYHNGYLYCVRGYGGNQFARYDPAANTWLSLTGLPDTVYEGRGIAGAGNYLYALRGRGTNTFWRYDISGNTWTAMATTPAVTSYGCDLVYPGTGDFIYASQGNNTKAFWKYSISGNTWTALTSAPFNFYNKGILMYPGSGNYFYVNFGQDVSFARYDFSADTWEVLKSYPCWTDHYQAGAAAGDKIYATYYQDYAMNTYTISTGQWDSPPNNAPNLTYGSVVYPGGDTVFMVYGNNTSVFWKYSLSQKKWTGLIKAPFLLGYGTKATYPGSGNYMYVLQGLVSRKLWRYDFVNDAWSAMSDAPMYFYGGDQFDGQGDVLFAAQGRDVTNASSNSSALFYKYTISTDTWARLADLPAAITSSYPNGNNLVHIPAQNRVYWKRANNAAEFYAYDTVNNVWLTLVAGAVGTSGQALHYPGSGDTIYYFAQAGGGMFYGYSISGNAWTTLKRCGRAWAYSAYDADMFSEDGGDLIYLHDANLKYFTRYSVQNNDWDQPSTLPDSSSYQYYSALAAGKDPNLLYMAAYTGFWKYDITTRAWTSITSPYTTIGWYWAEWQPALIYPGFGDYMYATQGRNYSNFARYFLTNNTWHSLTPPPATFGSGHRLAGAGSMVYCLRGGATRTFWRYSPALNTWTAMADMPDTASFGATLIYPGSGDLIYATRGNSGQEFYKYSISANSWSSLASLPVTLPATSGGGAMVYPGRGDHLYLFPSSNYGASAPLNSFYRYSISGNSWQELTAGTPLGIFGMSDLVYPGAGNYIYARRGYIQYDLMKYLVFTQGTYTSPIRNVGRNVDYNVASWTDNSEGTIELKARTSDRADLSDATDWQDVPLRRKGEDLSDSYPVVQPFDQYLQYQLRFLTDDLSAIPVLDDISVAYDKYRHRQELVSSAYDTGKTQNRLMKLSWHSVSPWGTDIRFLLRTAPDNNGVPGTWSAWLGPAGTQTFHDDYETPGDYAYDPLVTVTDGVARLTRQLEDYSHTQRIVLDNTAGTTDYTDRVVTLTVGPDNKYFWENVKADGSDVRFVDTSGNLLTYNLSTNGGSFSYTAQTASVLVRVPYIALGQKTSIYLKYGNPEAVSASDSTLSASLIFGAGGAVDSAQFNHAYAVLQDNDTVARLNGGSYTWGQKYLSYKTTYQRSGAWTFYFRFMQDAQSPNHTMIGWKDNSGTYTYSSLPYAFYFNNGSLSIYEMGSSVATIGAYSRNTWYDCKIVLKPGSGAAYYWRPTGSSTWTLVRDTSNRSEDNLRPSLDHYSQVPVMYTKDWVIQLDGNDYGGTGVMPHYFSVVEDSAAASSLSGWDYRSEVEIDNTDGPALTNYQIKVDLTSAYDGFWERCRDDGFDVRFVDSDNETVLSHYRASFDHTGKTATFWVKVPSVPAGTVKRVYLYYGRADAADTSSFLNTLTKNFNEAAARNTSALAVDGASALASVASSASLGVTGAVTVEANVRYDIDHWPTGWTYRKRVTINNAGRAGESSQIVRFSVPYDPAMKADYTDLRFWSTDHGRKLRYNIQSYDGTAAQVQLEVPSLPADSTQDVYMYYGNASAGNELDANLNAAVTGLVAWWKFDETSGTAAADSSSSGNNGTLSGAVAWTAGKYGNALNFTGGSVGFGNPVSLRITGSQTIAMWVRPNDFGGRRNPYNKAYGGEGTMTIETNGTVSYFYGTSGTDGGSYQGVTSPVMLTAGTWTHIALVRDLTNMTVKWFKDGVVVSSVAANYAAAVAGGNSVTVGTGYAGAFQGLLDNITVFNRALGASEVQSVMNNNFTGVVLPVTLGGASTMPALLRWLPGFAYRKKVTVSNAGGSELTSAILSLTVPFVNGKMKADYTDIAFVDTDGKRIAHQIFSTAAGQAVFYLTLPLVPANSTKDIYMYYGNPSLSVASSQDMVAVSASGLAAYWKMNEGTGTAIADSSGRGFTGTLFGTGGAWSGTAGYSNNGAYTGFDIGTASPVADGSDFTFSGWVNVLSDFSNEYIGLYCAWNGSLPSQYWLGIRRTTGTSGWGMHYNDGTNALDYMGATLSVGTWNHFAFVVQGSERRFYFNGTLIASAAGSRVGFPGGARNSGTAGTVRTVGVTTYASNLNTHTTKQVAVYNRALSAAEIQTLMSATGASQLSQATFGSEEAAPAIDQVLAAKDGAYGLKFTSTGLTGFVNGAAASTLNYSTGTFIHAAVSYDGEAVRLFTDGTLQGSSVLTGAISANANPLEIGRGLKGAVDEVRVWNVARAAGDIKENRERYISSMSAGLAAYLRFNEGTGTAAVDATANSNNATLMNSAGWLAYPFLYSNSAAAVYHMDEGVGLATADASGNANNATLSGTTWSTTDLTGFSNGRSLNFNGVTSYGTAADSSTLDITGQISLEAWIRPAVNIGTHLILCKGSDSASRWNYKLYQSADALAFSFYNGTERLHMTTAGLISAGTLYHVVATFDESVNTVKVYLNGALAYTSTAETSSMTANSDLLYIGREASTTNGFSGLMDGVRVYGRVLGADEVLAHYQARTYAITPAVVYDVLSPDVSVDIGAYATTNPVIQPVWGTFYTSQSLIELQELANKPAGTEIKYQVSPDGYSWHWYDGSDWVQTTGGYSQANTAAQVNTNLASFQALFPSGNFYCRAYLHTDPSVFRTPSLDDMAVSLATGESYYSDLTGAAAINPLHSDAANDRWFQYKAILYSEGQDTPVLDDVSVEYIESFLTLTAPNGGETLAVAAQVPVTWDSQALQTTGGSGLIKVQYSSDNGSVYTTIAEHLANTGSYTWTVPDAPTQQGLIKVSSEDLPAVSDTSDVPFKILSIQLTSPAGGAVWEGGKLHNITWTSTGTVPNNVLKIEYSTNGGTSWQTISAVAPNSGTYAWTVPSNYSDNVLLRLSSPTDARISDTSLAPFSIVPVPAFSLLSPAGGEEWSVGSAQTISWRTNSLVFSSNVILEYSTDSFQSDISAVATVAVGTPLGANKNDDIAGSYAWTVPDRVAGSVKVRVREATLPAGRDTQQKVATTSAAFSITEPSFTLTSPAADDVWVVGESQDITWSAEGSVSNDLLVEFSLDGENFTQIATGVTNSGTYAWTIPPGAAGDAVVVRISDNQRPQVMGVSAAFRVLPNAVVEVIAPNGGEVLTMGTDYTVRWRTYGKKMEPGGADYSKISIYYSTNNGVDWTLVAFNLSNTGSYIWRVPDIETDEALIRVLDQEDSLAVGQSAEVFTIDQPRITLTSPAGGEAWYATGSYMVTWTPEGSVSDNLRFEYSTNSGNTWTIFATGQPNTGEMLWGPIADVISSTVRVRVIDASRPTVTDASAEDFSIIPPAITLTSPNGGELWAVGTAQAVRWSFEGAAQGAIRDNITLQYSKNGGTSWTNIATGLLNSGVYEWTVPDDISSACRVRVFDATRPATVDSSDANFSIVLPSVTVTSPNGGEEWPIGTSHDITWTSNGTVSDNLKIEYSKNNFTTATTIASGVPNTGSYTWNPVPDDYSTTVKVRITDTSRPVITAMSAAAFSISYPILTLLSPNGGNLFTVGDVENITWDVLGSLVGPLKLEYSKDNFVTPAAVINSNIDKALRTYAWTVPDDVSATVRVRVMDLGRTQVWDKSDTNLTILPAPVITITSPAESDSWSVGSTRNITWTDNGGRISNNLTLQYSSNGGSSWNNIASGVPNTGTYAWTVPDALSATAKVKIIDASRPTTVAVSGVFNIVDPTITLTSPNGGEVWAVGDRGPVAWTTDGAVSDNLVLEYSPDAGATWYLVRGGIPNTGAYSWTVPDYVTVNCILRIKDGNRLSVADVSDDVFTINPMPTINITAPAGGQEYVLGNTVSITWETTGLSIGNMSLDYSNDNFNTRRIIATNLANTGAYTWTIPQDALTGQTIQLRLTDGTRTEITDKSDGYIRIRGGFNVTSPNGGEQWVAKSPQTITWQTLGTIPTVKLEYTTDGVNWNFISSTSNAGTYAWTLPDVKSTTVKVRVSDADDPTTFGTSSADFSIVYATVVFKLLDYDSLQHVQDFGVSEPATGWNDTGMVSPITRTAMYPYAAYTTFFTKQNYIDNSVSWSPPKQGTTPYNITVYIENSANAQVSWEAILTYSFSPANDSLSAVGSLQRKGKLIGTTELERADLGVATFTIYEPDGETVRNALTATSPAATGMYNFTLVDTQFEGGVVYPATLSISYREQTYVSSANIDVGSEILQYEFFTQTATQLAQSVENIENTVLATAAEIKTDIKGAIESTRSDIKGDTARILSATENAIPAKVEEFRETTENLLKSKILNSENEIRAGDTLAIRYRTISGLSPVVDVYDPDNKQKVAAARMTEIGTTGIYEYALQFLGSWGKGDYTIVCSESTNGTMDAMTITVMTTDIDQLSNQVSNITGATSNLQIMNATMDTLGKQFSSIETVLNRTSQDIVKGVKDAMGSANTLNSLFTQLSGVSRQLRDLGGDKGLSLEKLYDVSTEGQQDIKYLKNKTQELKAALEINQKLMEDAAYTPLVQTWFEYK
jgi:hypothetical protein